MLANGNKHITKGDFLLSIPRSLLKRNISIGIEVLTKKSNKTIESEQTWRRSFNRPNSVILTKGVG